MRTMLPRRLILSALLVASVALAGAAWHIATRTRVENQSYGSALQQAMSTVGSEHSLRAVEPRAGLRGFATKRYIIFSQLSDETTLDVARRLEAMYDYYASRFAKVIYPINFPKQVYLFNNRADFVAAGGHRMMPGQWMSGHDSNLGARVMMIFHEGNIVAFMSSCPLLYHEAFHQFVSVEIAQAGNVNRMWPLWLDEAYATKFNNITWTGDGWVDGNLRMEYASSAADGIKSFIPLRRLLNITGAGWHRLTNQGSIWPVYMQGMSLVYFLNHTADGKYRELLSDYVERVSTGQDTSAAAAKIIGLQAEFQDWAEQNMSPHITAAKYYEILTAMATSQLARAHARGQWFASGREFLAKAKANELKKPAVDHADWLPDSLRKEMLHYHETLTESNKPFEFNISYPLAGGTPVVRVYQPRFGLELEGTFELDPTGKVLNVAVRYVRCPSLNLEEAKLAVGTID